MSYTPRMRDRFKNLVALLTGAATFVSVAATGAATGLAAHDTAQRDQRRALDMADTAQRNVASDSGTGRTTPALRPQRTVVHTTVIHRAARGGVASVGPGGTVSRTETPSSRSVGLTGTGGTKAQADPAHRAPAPPLPAPAPSSGS